MQCLKSLMDLLNESSGSGMDMKDNGSFNHPPFCRYGIGMNSSVITFPQQWAIANQVTKFVPYIAALEAVFLLISFFWNFLILFSFVARMNLLKEPACIYLFNLALTDLMLSISVVLQCFAVQCSGGFIVGNSDVTRCGLCQFLGFMLMFLMASTLHTLAALSFDRFFLLIRPLRYHQYFNWKRAVIIVIFFWILSFCLAIPPIFGFGEYIFNPILGNCHPSWESSSFKGIANFHYIVLIAAEALIPIFILIVTNIWTCKVVIGVLRARYQRHKNFITRSEYSTSSYTNSDRHYSQQQFQLVKVFGAFFLAHICCWMPVLTAVVVALIIGRTRIPYLVFIVSWMFYLSNPVVHPILETFFIKDLRVRVKKARNSVKRSIRKAASYIQRSSLKKKNSNSSLTREANSTRYTGRVTDIECLSDISKSVHKERVVCNGGQDLIITLSPVPVETRDSEILTNGFIKTDKDESTAMHAKLSGVPACFTNSVHKSELVNHSQPTDTSISQTLAGSSDLPRSNGLQFMIQPLHTHALDETSELPQAAHHVHSDSMLGNEKPCTFTTSFVIIYDCENKRVEIEV